MRYLLDRAYAAQRLISWRRYTLRQYMEWLDIAVWAGVYLTIAAAAICSTLS